jgi:ferredoxin
LRVDGIEGRLLRSGDQLWLGVQILVLRRDDEGWQIRHHGPDGLLRETHPVPADGLFIGRGSDLVLDLEDSRLSRRHAQLVPEGDDLRLYDRGAHNGTYLKLVNSGPLVDGDEFRLGANRFRYVERQLAELEQPAPEGASDIESATIVDQADATIEVETTLPVATEAAPASNGRAGQNDEPRRRRGLAARLRKLGGRSQQDKVMPVPSQRDAASEELSSADKVLVVLDSEERSVSIEVAVGKTILEAVQEAGLERGQPVDWECGDGGCGVCVLGVVEGADRMDPPDPKSGEMKTIQITEQVVPDPKQYRLACLARVRGTVRLRKLT